MSVRRFALVIALGGISVVACGLDARGVAPPDAGAVPDATSSGYVPPPEGPPPSSPEAGPLDAGDDAAPPDDAGVRDGAAPDGGDAGAPGDAGQTDGGDAAAPDAGICVTAADCATNRQVCLAGLCTRCQDGFPTTKGLTCKNGKTCDGPGYCG